MIAVFRFLPKAFRIVAGLIEFRFDPISIEQLCEIVRLG